MYLPVEPGRLIEGPVNRGPENRGCTVQLTYGRSCNTNSALQDRIVAAWPTAQNKRR